MWMLAYLFWALVGLSSSRVFGHIRQDRLPVFAVFGFFGQAGRGAERWARLCLRVTPLVVLSGAVFVLVIVLFLPLYQKLYVPPSRGAS